MNYFKVEIGQVLFWGCKGHFRKHGPGLWKSPHGTALSHGHGRSVEEARPCAGMQFVLLVKLKKKRSFRTPIDCKPQVVWKKKN